MATNSLKYTTHEGVERTVPIDTVRLVRPLTDEDKAKTKANLKENRGIDIDPNRIIPYRILGQDIQTRPRDT